MIPQLRELESNMNGIIQTYGLVRDKDGNPKIDDPENAPAPVLAMLTPQERRDRGIWDGVFVIDAEGTKKAIQRDDGTFEAVDALVAATVVLVDANTHHLIRPRVDVRPGGTIPI